MSDLGKWETDPEAAHAEAAEVTYDGTELLGELHAFIKKYVILTLPEHYDAVTLWIAATHAQQAWEIAARLVIKAPEKRCGKSRLLDVVGATSHDHIPTANISIAALVHSITEDNPPTVLLDEADTVFGKGKNAEKSEDLRGILNAGHQRGRSYIRWDPMHRQREELPTFCMVAIAGIGNFPGTIEDRAVIIPMRRRAKGERVAAWRERRDAPAAHDLRGRLHAWLRANIDELQGATPSMPVEDREADTWESLVAVADLAGGDWPKRAREACLRICNGSRVVEKMEEHEELLRDLHVIFNAHAGVDALPTKVLINELAAIEDGPWGRRVLDILQPSIDPRGLKEKLKNYVGEEEVPRKVRIGKDTISGIKREWLEPVWARYCRCVSCSISVPGERG